MTDERIKIFPPIQRRWHMENGKASLVIPESLRCVYVCDIERKMLSLACVGLCLSSIQRDLLRKLSFNLPEGESWKLWKNCLHHIDRILLSEGEYIELNVSCGASNGLPLKADIYSRKV